MKKWEIWKSKRIQIGKDDKPTQKDYKACDTLHRRYETRSEANKVIKEMKRQNILCCVRKRKELV